MIDVGKDFERISEGGEKLQIVDSLGTAKDLIDTPERLKEYSMWMDIGTNIKTYPNDMVADYADWISRHSNSGLIVIADDLQLYNKVPLSKKG